MPVSSRIAQKGQQTESFESSYRSETSFKNFSAFLNRPLTVYSRNPNQYAQFSLVEILKHIDLNKAILKGSTVKHWRSDKPPADIDLQLSCSNSIDKSDLARSLLEFLNSRSNRAIRNSQDIKEKVWFSKVKHHLSDAWVRLIFNVGYPRQNASTLDLNFTNYRGIAHDAIHASPAIQFDWTQRKAFNVGSWHPHLVECLQKNHLLWFNPDIDEGLGRLSYRLSKSPNATLLQPALVDHFFEQATHTNICNIYMRVLMNEYPRSTLNGEEKTILWEPIISAAGEGNQEVLRNDVLAWCKFNTLKQLRTALHQPDTQAIVLDQLTNACQVGLNFKTAVKELLMSNEELIEPLRPLISKALGASLVQGELLFNMLDHWDQIQDVPEHELQTVFSDCLKSLVQSADPIVSSRANNMLGWLNGDDLASLKFWIERIPETHHNAPPEKLMKPVMQTILQIIKTQGADGLKPAFPGLGKLRISLANWHTLAHALGNAPANRAPQTAANPSENLTVEFMHILTRQSAAISAMAPKGISTALASGKPMQTQRLYQEFHQHLMRYLTALDGQKTPPILRNILTVKSDGIDIALSGMVLAVSREQGSVTANIGTSKYWITEHGRGAVTQQPRHGPNVFQVHWHDGSFFTGQSSTPGNFNVDGVLTRISREPLPAGFTNFLNTGRSLCLSKFTGLALEEQSWTAKGIFSGKQVLKANGLIDALLAMKQGVIVDQALNHELRIEHEIKDGKPVSCTVSVVEQHRHTEMKFPYFQVSDPAKLQTGLNNPWRVAPVMSKVESLQQINCPPFGIIDFSTTLPWNEETQTLQGMGEIRGSGLIKFKWAGHLTPKGLFPDGSLYLEKQKTPAIVFNDEKRSSNIPVSLLPVMADLLGHRLNGSYPFSPVVWHDPDRWPIPGFEGFVNQYTYRNLVFSGYLTSTGRAIGILSETTEPGRDHSSAWAGAFYVRPRSLLDYRPVGIDQQEEHLACVPLSANEVLTPHGIVREYLLTKESQKPCARVDRVYFCGEGLSFRQITQSPELTYDSPNQTRYLVGLDYALDQKPKHLDIVFNPGDGGNDFLVVRPLDFDKQSNYQELYRDSLGTSASWLVVNREYRMVNIQFPSGVEYSGKIEKQDNFYRPRGSGKIIFGGLSFTADFEHNGTIRDLKATNSASADWLAANAQSTNNPTFTLKDWVKLISDGRLDWQNDLLAHLQVRNLGSFKNKSTVFSRR